MNTNSLKLKNKIMRRIYFIFAVRIVEHPITLQVATFGLALVVLAKLVHVHRVTESFLSTSVGHLPQYLFNTVASAFMRGEVLTLLVVGVLIFTALSVPLQLGRTFVPKFMREATS